MLSHEKAAKKAAAITHLDHWQSRYPKSAFCPDRESIVVREVFGNRLDLGKRRVRPLVLGLVVVMQWMECFEPAVILEEAKSLVWLHVEAVMALSNCQTVRVHLRHMYWRKYNRNTIGQLEEFCRKKGIVALHKLELTENNLRPSDFVI